MSQFRTAIETQVEALLRAAESHAGIADELAVTAGRLESAACFGEAEALRLLGREQRVASLERMAQAGAALAAFGGPSLI